MRTQHIGVSKIVIRLLGTSGESPMRKTNPAQQGLQQSSMNRSTEKNESYCQANVLTIPSM